MAPKAYKRTQKYLEKYLGEREVCLCTTKELENFLSLPKGLRSCSELLVLQTPDDVDQCKA